MGLLKAGLGAAGGVMADQWKEFIYCESMPADVLACKGSKRTGGRSSNTRGEDNVISNGSVIAVNDGQGMLVVQNGKIIEVALEPGEFVFDTGSEPSVFSGNLGDSIKETFANIGSRFTFGGDAGKDQRVYFINTKEIIGNKKKLVKWQDEFWQHMVKQYPELERGESASQTGREHIPPRIFKEMTQLTKQKEQLDALLVGITPFNGKSRAAEISKVLDSYIPNVARMKDQLRKYNVAFTKTAAENEKLKEKNRTLSAALDKAKEGSVLKRLEDAKLRKDYEAALKTLDSIPPEVIRFYENRRQEPAMRHDK